MRYEIGHISLQGDRRENQDRHAVIESDHGLLLVVADGMGGHPKGEAAAQILIDTCKREFPQTAKAGTKPGEILGQLLQRAHKDIVAYGAKQNPPIGPRTTAVLALVQGRTAYWVHVGDSRLYLFRGGQPLYRTLDHSHVEELIQKGIISEGKRQTHPYRHYVTQCLGGDAAPPEIAIGTPTQLERGDILVLCSDGFWAKLRSEIIGKALQGPLPISASIKTLAHKAQELAAPESDNITAIALRVLEEGAASLYKTDEKTATPDPDEEAARLEKAIDELKDAIERFHQDQQETP